MGSVLISMNEALVRCGVGNLCVPLEVTSEVGGRRRKYEDERLAEKRVLVGEWERNPTSGDGGREARGP